MSELAARFPRQSKYRPVMVPTPPSYPPPQRLQQQTQEHNQVLEEESYVDPFIGFMPDWD